MVEAKCIEVDNKQATLAQADPGAQPKLNNEQWQALIALHRTLLHEHHDCKQLNLIATRTGRSDIAPTLGSEKRQY